MNALSTSLRPLPHHFETLRGTITSAWKDYAAITERREQLNLLIQTCQDLLSISASREPSQAASVHDQKFRSERSELLQKACEAVRVTASHLARETFTSRLLRQSEISRDIQSAEDAVQTTIVNLDMGISLNSSNFRISMASARTKDRETFIASLNELMMDSSQLMDVLVNDGREHRRLQELIMALTKYRKTPETSELDSVPLQFIRAAISILQGHSDEHVPEPEQWLLTSFEVEFNTDDRHAFIGRGHFGNVYRGKWQGRAVAVKAMFWKDAQNLDRSKMMAVRRQFHVWSKLNHPNVLPFHGGCAEALRPFIVTTLCFGNILEFLRANPQAIRIALLHQTADGMSYLHDNSVVHGNLRASNVMVNEKCEALVADYGLSVFHDALPSRHPGSEHDIVQWPAPEIINGEPITPAVDVYSFAITAWEIYMDASDEANDQSTIYSGVFRQNADTGTLDRPQKLKDDLLWGLIQRCWRYDSSERPLFADVATGLGMIRNGFANKLPEVEQMFQSFEDLNLQLSDRASILLDEAEKYRRNVGPGSDTLSILSAPRSPVSSRRRFSFRSSPGTIHRSPRALNRTSMMTNSASGSDSVHSARTTVTTPASPSEAFILTELEAVQKWIYGGGGLRRNTMPDFSALESFLVDSHSESIHSHVLFALIPLSEREQGRDALRAHPGFISALLNTMYAEPSNAVQAARCLANLALDDDVSFLVDNTNFMTDLAAILQREDDVPLKEVALECIRNISASKNKQGCIALKGYRPLLQQVAEQLAKRSSTMSSSISDPLREHALCILTNIADGGGQEALLALPDFLDHILAHVSGESSRVMKIREEAARCCAKLVNDEKSQWSIINHAGFLGTFCSVINLSVPGPRDAMLREHIARCLATLSKSDTNHNAMIREDSLVMFLVRMCPLDAGIQIKTVDYVSICLASLSMSALGRQSLRNPTIKATLKYMHKHGAETARRNAKVALDNLKKLRSVWGS